MAIIYTSSGVEIYVDIEDYDWLRQFSWHISHQGYAHRNASKSSTGNKFTLMHRMILNIVGPNIIVDHIDGNKLNNQRNNLRIGTNQLNQANSRMSKNNTSGYKGVIWNKERNKWQAQIMVNRRYMFLGRFDDIHEAANAYDVAAVKYFGSFAYTNKDMR